MLPFSVFLLVLRIPFAVALVSYSVRQGLQPVVLLRDASLIIVLENIMDDTWTLCMLTLLQAFAGW